MKTLIFMDTNISRLQDRINELVSGSKIVNTRQYCRKDDSGILRMFIAVDYEED